MKRIKLTQGRIGDNFADERGDVIEVSEEEFDRMILKGHGRPVPGNDPEFYTETDEEEIETGMIAGGIPRRRRGRPRKGDV